MRILAIGATGQYAAWSFLRSWRRVCRCGHWCTIRPGPTASAGQGRPRPPAKADRVRVAGAIEAGGGDLRDRASIDAALTGVDGVFHITPAFAPHAVELGVAMVAAATAAGQQRFVFSGVYHRRCRW